MLGAYSRDMLTENDKQLLGLGEGNKLALLYFFFCTPKRSVSYMFQSANRSKGQASTFGLYPDEAGGPRLICCANVRRPPLESPEYNHNLADAKIRIPRRSATNRRKRDRTKETTKTADFRRLMADPNLR